MLLSKKLLSLLIVSGLLLSCSSEKKDSLSYQVSVEYHQLKNGLKVVFSPDKTSPIVTVAVYYNIGFRIEPQNRTGFAHLFEHMMFQGSENLGKMEFINLVQSNGGILNGSTRFDFTNYFQIVPSNKLETMLWAESDRMKGLAITEENLENQKGVVKNEVKVNVINQPYGGFPWLDLPQYANTNWFNAHNFYGDLADLEAATLEDVKTFFDTYYSPNNAVLVLSGDLDSKEALDMVRKYFENIPSSTLPAKPDLSEPRQEAEKKFTKVDLLATKPALAHGYHMPERNSPEFYAMGLIQQILLVGNDSRLYNKLVKEKAITSSVDGGINLLGNLFNYNGPMLFTISLIHDQQISQDSITAWIDEEIAILANHPINNETMALAQTKFKSNFYSILGGLYGFGKADLLASFALFDDNPYRINEIEREIAKVTPELIQKTVKEYLRSTNRTALSLQPKIVDQEKK